MEKSVELKELTLQLYKAMETGDMEFFGNHVSQEEGSLAVGTDPEEWWEGHDVITNVFEAQLKEMKGFSITGSDSQAYTEGSVGWVADRIEFKLPNGTVVPARLTTICHKEAGEWKIVQWHFSLGVPNEEVFDQDLPTS